MKNLVELMENFEGTINVLGNDKKMYEVNELIKDFDSKKDFSALGINYWSVDCFGRATQRNDTISQIDERKPVTDLKEILEWILSLLEEGGEVYQCCESCGHWFTSGEGMYRLDDLGNYLCNEKCFHERFKTDREWHIYALEDWYKEFDCNETWTKEELEQLSDNELADLMDMAVDDTDFPCYYTEP